MAVIAAAIWFAPRGCASLKTWILENIAIVRSTATATLQSALGELRVKGGLQVGWRTIDTTIELDRATNLNLWIWKPEIGSVHIRLAVEGNRALYVIPAEPAWTIDTLDERTFIVTVPPPTINADVVEVQSDPSKYRVSIDNDWVEHLIPSGRDIDDAKRMVRDSVVHTATSAPALAEVRVAARQAAEQFLRGVLDGAGINGARVIVRFADEDNARTDPLR